VGATQSTESARKSYRVEVKSSLNSRLARAAQRIEPASHARSGQFLLENGSNFVLFNRSTFRTIRSVPYIHKVRRRPNP